MRFAFVLISFLATASVTTQAYSKEEPYTILAIEAASYRGVMTAKLIKLMEQKAYYIARDNYCIERKSQRVAMPELFDMMAGSETGAIIASTLALPNDDPATMAKQKNKYFSDRLIDFFETDGEYLFHNSKVATSIKSIITLLFVAAFVYIIFRYAEEYLRIDHFETLVDDLEKLIRLYKKKQRNPEKVGEDALRDAVRCCNKHCMADSVPFKSRSVRKIFRDLQGYEELANEDTRINPEFPEEENAEQRGDYVQSLLREGEDPVDLLTRIERHIIQFSIHKKQEFYGVWLAFISVALLIALVVFFGLIPGVNFVITAQKSSQVLESYLVNPKLIPKDMSIQSTITDDLMLTAWDLNNRSPRFFTKETQKSLKTQEYDHDLTLGQMTLASTSTPYYFRPAEINGNIYLSGDNLAISPALFAYLYVNEEKGVPLDSIRVLSVGSTSEMPEKLSESASLLDWVSRLLKLTTPVKKNTHDWTITQMLNKQNRNFHQVQIDTSAGWESELYLTSDRTKMLDDKFADLVYEDKGALYQALKLVVLQKFKDKDQCKK